VCRAVVSSALSPATMLLRCRIGSSPRCTALDSLSKFDEERCLSDRRLPQQRGLGPVDRRKPPDERNVLRVGVQSLLTRERGIDRGITLYYNVVVSAVRRVSTFRLDDVLLEGMQVIWERDGIQPSEQVRRALRAWLESKGIKMKATLRGALTGRRV